MTPQSMPHRLTAGAISHSLGTRRVGRHVEVHDQLDSTNACLLRRVAEGGADAIDGLVVFAEHQTQGRGRLGRAWQSPRGASLLFSFALWEPLRRLSAGWVMMATAVAAVRGIEAATEIEPLLRWPNDLYVRDRKLGGILVEQRTAEKGMGIAVGIGVNCLQSAGHFGEEVGRLATSLDIESSLAVDRVRVAQSLLRQLDSLFEMPQKTDDEELAAAWLAHSADLGAHVALTSGGQTFRGRIIDIHPTSGLVLQLDDGGRRHFDPAITSRA